MAPKQTELFDVPIKTRIKRAHVCDAGEGIKGFPYGAQFECKRCNWTSPWLCFETISEIRRGIPCDYCNPDLEIA